MNLKVENLESCNDHLVYDVELGMYVRELNEEEQKYLDKIFDYGTRILQSCVIISMIVCSGGGKAFARTNTNNSQSIVMIQKKNQRPNLDIGDFKQITNKKANKNTKTISKSEISTTSKSSHQASNSFKKQDKISAQKNNFTLKKKFIAPTFNNEKFATNVFGRLEGGQGAFDTFSRDYMRYRSDVNRKSFMYGFTSAFLLVLVHELINLMRAYLKNQQRIQELRGGWSKKKQSNFDKFLFGSKEKENKKKETPSIFLVPLTPIFVGVIILSPILFPEVRLYLKEKWQRIKEKWNIKKLRRKKPFSLKKILNERILEILFIPSLFIIYNKRETITFKSKAFFYTLLEHERVQQLSNIFKFYVQSLKLVNNENMTNNYLNSSTFDPSILKMDRINIGNALKNGL